MQSVRLSDLDMEKGQVNSNVPSAEDIEALPSPICTGPTVSVSRLAIFSHVGFRITSLHYKLKEWLSALMPEKPARSSAIIRKVEDAPIGYPRVATFLESDDSFMIYRRFGFLHSRLLLYKQDELRELEEDLRSMDTADGRNKETQRYLMCRRKDDARQVPEDQKSRKELMQQIEKKTVEYGQLLLQAQQLVSMNRPSSRDQTSLVNFMGTDPPLLGGDIDFVHEKEDHITLRPGRENFAWLDAFVEQTLRVIHCKPIQYIFCSKETRAKTAKLDIHYYTRERIDAFVTMIITVVVLILLVIPLWLLYHLTVTLGINKASKAPIEIVLAATLIFSAVLSLFTKARRHEILGAAAGYCAVLVVFVGNISNNSFTNSN